MSNVIEKTFLQALKLVLNDVEKAKRYYKDKRLTLTEKKILKMWVAVRSGQYESSLKELDGLKSESSTTIDSQKKYLKGACLFGLRRMSEAKISLLKAEDGILAMNIDYFTFFYYRMLFNIANSHDDLVDMKKYILKLNEFTDCHENRCRYLLDNTSYQLKSDNLSVMRSLLDKLKSMDFPKSLTHDYLVNEFRYSSYLEDWNRCEELLCEFKKVRQFKISANYFYMRTILDSIIHKKPIYIKHGKFDSYEYMFFQLSVLKGIEEDDLENAILYWSKLKSIDPLRYAENFDFTGTKCSFSYCLEMLVKQMTTKSSSIIINSNMNDEEKLFEILNQFGKPVSKEKLFEQIWSRELLTEKDEKLFHNCLYRARKLNKEKIRFRKGCYLLDKKAA